MRETIFQIRCSRSFGRAGAGAVRGATAAPTDLIISASVTGRRDPRLHAFLDAADEAAAAHELDRLVRECVDPIARQVIARRVRSPIDRQDAEDLQNDVHVQLAARLAALRGAPADDEIADLAGYVAVVAHRAYDAYLRRRFPLRARLKSRVRYAMTHHPDLALQLASEGWTCGLRSSTVGPSAGGGRERLQHLQRHRLTPPGLEGEDLQHVGLGRLLPALLTAAGGPVELDDLVSALADLLGVSDAAPPSRDEDGDGSWLDRLPDSASTPAEQAEARDYLRRLWSEIDTLPVAQRRALLLNLRDEQGQGVIGLLALTETATLSQIASTLEMTAGELSDLWPDLPIDDARIAGRLALTRQQVINLRKSARLRLARRMRPLQVGI